MTASIASAERLRVGVIGFGWMGRVHARAYTRLAQHYPTLTAAPELVAVADNAPDDRLAAAAQVFGFRDVHADWRELVARDDPAKRVDRADPNAGPAPHGHFLHQRRHLWRERRPRRAPQRTRPP